MFISQLTISCCCVSQVWDGTPELEEFQADRFKLELSESLAAVFRKLAAQSLAENVNPNTWMHHATRCSEHVKSDTAHQRVQKLQHQSQIGKLCNQPPSISSIPLVNTAHGLVHDPSVLPILPPCFKKHWTTGPLHAKPHPNWSEFHTLSFESAQSLVQQAGPGGGIYQIWVSRRVMLPNGTCKVMRAEVYVGSAIGTPVNMLAAEAINLCSLCCAVLLIFLLGLCAPSTVVSLLLCMLWSTHVSPWLQC